MSNRQHVKIARQGAAKIREWYENHLADTFDLSKSRLKNVQLGDAMLNGVDLSGADLRGANLSGAQLNWADMRGANLVDANLSEVDLTDTDLCDAKLGRANLTSAVLWGSTLVEANLAQANFSKATLSKANLLGANLMGADFSGATLDRVFLTETNLKRAVFADAYLQNCDLRGADLSEANFATAQFEHVAFADNDLSKTKGLQLVKHFAPSSLGIDTIHKSKGEIPEEFLRGCGVPDAFIKAISEQIGMMQPIQFQSCFISYSSNDDEFARRLYSRLRDEKLRVWFAPEEMRGGKKLIDQIDRAIKANDRLLLVLSRDSIKSNWVRTEIKRARQVEYREKRQKLFPIRLVDFSQIRKWECFDADFGEDLAAAIREYHISDFSNWKNYDAFERAFSSLLRDLEAHG